MTTVTDEISLFWIRYGKGEWEPCHVDDCLVPVMPELRLCTEPRCFWHAYCCAPEKARKR